MTKPASNRLCRQWHPNDEPLTHTRADERTWKARIYFKYGDETTTTTTTTPTEGWHLATHQRQQETQMHGMLLCLCNLTPRTSRHLRRRHLWNPKLSKCGSRGHVESGVGQRRKQVARAPRTTSEPRDPRSYHRELAWDALIDVVAATLEKRGITRPTAPQGERKTRGEFISKKEEGRSTYQRKGSFHSPHPIHLKD